MRTKNRALTLMGLLALVGVGGSCRLRTERTNDTRNSGSSGAQFQKKSDQTQPNSDLAVDPKQSIVRKFEGSNNLAAVSTSLESLLPRIPSSPASAAGPNVVKAGAQGGKERLQPNKIRVVQVANTPARAMSVQRALNSAPSPNPSQPVNSSGYGKSPWTASNVQEVQIYDNQTSSVSLPLYTSAYAGRVEVEVDIIHDYSGDLTLTLVSPNGRSVILRDRRGGNERNIYESYTTRAFAGDNIYGNWALRVTDNATGDTGYVRSVRMTVFDDVQAGGSGSSTDPVPNPYGLSASNFNDDGTIDISWSPPSSTTEFYYFIVSASKVSQPAARCGYDQKATTTNTSVRLTNLDLDSTYYIRVCSSRYYSAAGSTTDVSEGVTTSIRTPEPPPPPPQEISDLSVFSRGSTSITLDWNSSNYASYYYVAYREGAVAPASCQTSDDSFTSTGATIYNLASTTQYSFRVCSANRTATSAGRTVSATTRLPTPPATLPFVDAFDRANQPEEVSGSWFEYPLGMILSGNKVVFNPANLGSGASASLELNAPNSRDVAVEADVSLLPIPAGKTINDGGLYVRSKFGERYVGRIALTADGSKAAQILRIQSTLGQIQAIFLCSKTITASSGHLRFEAFNDTLRLSLDGNQICQVLDSRLREGSIGLIGYHGGANFDNFSAKTITVGGMLPTDMNVLIASADKGSDPLVRLINPVTGQSIFEFYPYLTNFRGGVRSALGDITGDGVPDIITAAGPGGGPHLTVRDGKDGSIIPGPLGSFYAYAPTFGAGIYIASGDVDHDGFADIITGAGPGGGPHVTVRSGKDGSILRSFYAYDERVTSGVRVAAADVNGDGFVDIIAAPGPGMPSHIRVFSGKDQSELASFYSYDPKFLGGCFIAGGDVDGDGKAEIIIGADAGGGPHVKAVKADGTIVSSFFAFAPNVTTGVRVGTADINGDGIMEILTAAGPGGGPHVRIFDGRTGIQVPGPGGSFFSFPADFTNGQYIGGVLK